jgi:hypothetical protein
MAEQRRNRQARLTIPASDAWDRVCDEHNISLTALLEALGQLLSEGEAWIPDDAVKRARQLDRQRHSRRR